MRVLDIGCGWGEALKFAAERYGVSGSGSRSRRSRPPCATLCARPARGDPPAGLPRTRRHPRRRSLRPYLLHRHVRAQWACATIATSSKLARRCLIDDADTGGGLFLLHSIVSSESVRHTDPWIAPPYLPELDAAVRRAAGAVARGCIRHRGLAWLRPRLRRTLQAWRDNIEGAWHALPARYDERFRRMWRFYLAASMACSVREAQLWQLVLSPRGVPGVCGAAITGVASEVQAGRFTHRKHCGCAEWRPPRRCRC